MSALRVALVHPYSWPEIRRGGERYLADLAWYLTSVGHSVTVVTGTSASPGETVDEGVRYVRYGHRLPEALRRRGMTTDEAFGALVLRHLLRHRYDVVFALTPTAALAARACRQPTVYSVLGHPTEAALAGRPWLRRTFRAAVRLATTTAALSATSAGATAAVLGGSPIVLSPGVRLDRFPLGAEPRTGPPRILFPAFAEDRRKGLDVLMRAMPSVLAAHPDARLVLGGPGQHDWALDEVPGPDRAVVAGAVDTPGVGNLDDVPDRYRAATVTVLPSFDEAFGLVLVESLATGTPVVCTTSGGPQEIVEPGVGLAVAPYDSAALASAVGAAVELAADPATPARCRARAAEWDWTARVGPEHVDVLRRVSARRGGRTG